MKSVVLITGGIRGLGLAMAKAFAEDGYAVAINYRSDDKQAEEAQSLLQNALCIKADVTNPSDRESLLKQVIDHYGQLDILVNNAGIIRPGRLLDGSDQDFAEVLQCNLHAPIYLAKLFGNYLVSNQRAGSIINITTIGAHGGGNLAYCAAKAGLLNATKSMAKELGSHNIRVNCISPGFFPTELNRELREQNQASWDKRVSKLPLGGEGDSKEIGRAALYLASSSYTTGSEIVVDGGYLA